MDFFRKEFENSCRTLPSEDPQSEIEYYHEIELSSRPINMDLKPKTPDSKAIDLIANEFSLDKTIANHQHNSSFRKEFITLIQPAYNSQHDLQVRLNGPQQKQYSKSLLSRASKVHPQKAMMRNVLKNPTNESQNCQQVSVQASLAKQFLDDEIPMDSAHHRKFSSTKKQLFDKFKSFQMNRLPNSKVLNRTYFFQLLDEMKLTQVDTIQQCIYCMDLKDQTKLSPERLAKCFLHDHFKRYQTTAYLLDKKQLNEGSKFKQ